MEDRRYTPATVETTLEHLDGDRVRLTVAVAEDEFDEAVDAAFRKIAREVRLPGFRPGKAPRKILEARLGKSTGRQEALHDALPDYYSRALVENDVDVGAGEHFERSFAAVGKHYLVPAALEQVTQEAAAVFVVIDDENFSWRFHG